MKLLNRTVLITGGGAGIGLELARQLSARGNKVIITGRDQARLDKAQSLLPSLAAIRSDVSKPADIQALLERVTREFPALDVLVNNAGVMREINLHDQKTEDLTREIDINLSGTIRMVHAFLPHLKSRPQALIVNNTSGLAFVPLPTAPVYCATKAALHSFTQSLRVQLGRTNVQVVELAPPATETELLKFSDPADMKGVSVMKVDAMVAEAISGIEGDRFEIRPGQSNQLKFMSRLAPEFILKQLSRPVERMLSASGR